MSVVCVSIEPAGGDGWTATWSADGRPAGAPVALAAAAVRELSGLARRFDRLADPAAAHGRHTRPVLPAPEVDGIGAALRDRVVGPEAADALRTARELHVRTRLPDALNLPWELLPAGPTGKPIGTDADRALYRLAVAPPAADADAPPPGPLRVLFLAAAPTDQPQLHYEQEEELILKAVGGLVGVVVWSPRWGASRSSPGGCRRSSRTSSTCPGTAAWGPAGRPTSRSRRRTARPTRSGRTSWSVRRSTGYRSGASS